MTTPKWNWRAGTNRGPNLIEAHPQRLESADGTRWALGRNVKVALPDHRYEGVEVWTLKHRVDGKAVTVETHRDRDEAETWVKTGEK
jgi:hypothetical protein